MDEATLLNLSTKDLEKMNSSELVELRKFAQDKGDEFYTVQIAYKTLINSLYGALGHEAFILFNEKIAQAITSNGRYFIRTLGKNVDNALKDASKTDEEFWTYADTDSVYYTVNHFVKMYEHKHPDAGLLDKVDFCHRFEEKIVAPVIQKSIDEFCEQLNAYDASACGAKLEIIADKVIFMSKKRYLGRIRESESSVYAENHPKIKAMGIELIKSSTSNFAKKYLTESLDILFDGTNADLLNWLDTVKAKFRDSAISDVCTVASVSKIKYDFSKQKVPINSRAAIYYNNYLNEKKLTSKYTIINAGDKLRMVHMLTPNPFASEVKGANGKIIKPNIFAFMEDGFGELLRDYIDWDTQFEKTFIAPLKGMTDAIGLQTKRSMPSVFSFL